MPFKLNVLLLSAVYKLLLLRTEEVATVNCLQRYATASHFSATALCIVDCLQTLCYCPLFLFSATANCFHFSLLLLYCLYIYQPWNYYIFTIIVATASINHIITYRVRCCYCFIYPPLNHLWNYCY